jgi:hypothetical protein
LGSLLFALSTLAILCVPTEPVWNEYSGVLSASPTDPNVTLTSLRPGQTFYVWVYAIANVLPSDYYIVKRDYQIIAGGSIVVASSKPQCLGDRLYYYRCGEDWQLSTGRLIDILTITVDESPPLDLQTIPILGEAYDGSIFKGQFLNTSIPLERPALEVRYNGVPVPNTASIELVIGENPFSVHNISTAPLPLFVSNPRISVNGSIGLSQGFPGGVVNLQPGDSAPFSLFCNGQGEPNLVGVMEMDNNSSGGQFSLRLRCEPAPLPALGNQPENGGGGQIIVVTAEPPQPTEEATPIATEPPPVNCELDPFNPEC